MARHQLADSGDMSADGERVRARRERLGMDKKPLAELAGIDRDTLTALESGQGFRRSTLAKIEQALDELEAEAGFPPLGPPAGGSTEVVGNYGGLVTYRVHIGALNVDVTVQGPVGNIAELEASVERLLQRAQIASDTDE